MNSIAFDETESNYEIRFAKKSDIEKIMYFVKEYWSPTHILANSREMFDYQYVYENEVCFVISENKETHEIEGILGYIPYDSTNQRDVFLALWKVRKGKNLFQGIDLLYFLEEDARCKAIFCSGINPKTFSIYKYMKKYVTKMNHFYLLNNIDYKIAKIVNKKKTVIENIPYVVKLIREIGGLKIFGENSNMQSRPYKSKEYVQRRYFQHIKYQYFIYEVRTTVGLTYIVGREQEQNGNTIFRIVDIWGKDIAIETIGSFLHSLLREKNYEYIDCYAYGLDNALLRAGMQKIDENDDNIIPNYFEPFVQENTDIHIFVPQGLNTHMFKGDGDQDRPNKLID